MQILSVDQVLYAGGILGACLTNLHVPGGL